MREKVLPLLHAFGRVANERGKREALCRVRSTWPDWAVTCQWETNQTMFSRWADDGGAVRTGLDPGEK